MWHYVLGSPVFNIQVPGKRGTVNPMPEYSEQTVVINVFWKFSSLIFLQWSNKEGFRGAHVLLGNCDSPGPREKGCSFWRLQSRLGKNQGRPHPRWCHSSELQPGQHRQKQKGVSVPPGQGGTNALGRRKWHLLPTPETQICITAPVQKGLLPGKKRGQSSMSVGGSCGCSELREFSRDSDFDVQYLMLFLTDTRWWLLV